QLGALLLHPFCAQAVLLARNFLFPIAQLEALALDLGDVGIKLVEEAGDVLRLGAKARACRIDYRPVESKPLRDVDTGGSTRHADAQFVSWLKCSFIESH